MLEKNKLNKTKNNNNNNKNSNVILGSIFSVNTCALPHPSINGVSTYSSGIFDTVHSHKLFV